MTLSAFRTLLVEDNEADAYLVGKLLSSPRVSNPALGRFTLDSVSRLDAALELLALGRHDVVLLDLTLPDSQGLDTLRSVRASAAELPIVVLTGSADAELGLDALTLGAQDYLPKDGLNSAMILRTLRHAIERRRIQQQLVSALREKEVLLRELNHRAKNNLQVVTSLLSMQARRSDDQNFRALVGAARERIDSIALAHDKLNASANLSRIDFSDYLRTLACAVHRSYDGETRGIELCLEVGDHQLPLDRAVTAGLVVNELLTNALKHAFPDDRRGQIRIRLDSDAEWAFKRACRASIVRSASSWLRLWQSNSTRRSSTSTSAPEPGSG
jgi:two-component sensor histidine kinase